MTGYAAQVGTALLEMARNTDPQARIRLNYDGRPIDFEARAIFIQIINHGIEHRTNITTILNQDAQAAPELDGWSYLMANPDRFRPAVTMPRPSLRPPVPVNEID